MRAKSAKTGGKKLPKNLKTFDIDSSLGFIVNRTAYVLRQRLQEAFRRHKHTTTPEEFAVLRVLWKQDGRRQGELANYSFKDRTTITRLIDGLVRKKFVERKADATDRRVICTWLTKNGKDLEAELVPIAHALATQATQNISEKDLEATLRTLKTVQENAVGILH